MNILATFAIALGLSMDNFAVTIAWGCGARGRITQWQRLRVSLTFVLAHIVMISAGWLSGEALDNVVGKWDFWVAFGVLVFIGAKMIYEALTEAETQERGRNLSARVVIGLAVATSLDALGVGIALSLEDARFWLTLGLMSACVLITSYSGFVLGHLLGRRFGKRMEMLGGLVLIAIGTKMLFSGLGIW